MEVVNSPESFNRIAEYHREKFKNGMLQAMQDVQKHYVEVRHLYNPSELATVMHVHVKDRMTQNFEGVPGADIQRKPGRAYKIELDGAPIGIPGKAIFKCKKINSKLLTANITTGAVRRFNNQQSEVHVQLPIADWVQPKTTGGTEPAHGNVGYIPNAFWTDFERLCVTYYTGLRSAVLVLEIPLNQAGTSAEVIEIPLGEITEAPARKRVKPRRKKAEIETIEGHEKKEAKKRIKSETKEIEPATEQKQKKRKKSE